MKILNFLDNVEGKITRFNVVSTLDNEIEYMENKLLPLFEKVRKTYPGEIPDTLETFTHVLNETGKLGKGKGLKGLEGVVEAYIKQAKTIRSNFDAIFNDDSILRDALTYRVVTIVQYTEAMAFATRYISRLLDAFLYMEYVKANDGEIKVSAYQRNMCEWLERNKVSFISLMRIGQRRDKEVSKDIMEIPDKVVNVENIEEDVKSARYGAASLDPLNFGIITGKWSPIYLAQDAYHRARAALNDFRKSRLESIEIKLVYMKEANAGKRDPRLQDKIERMESSKKKLFQKVSAYEEDA